MSEEPQRPEEPQRRLSTGAFLGLLAVIACAAMLAGWWVAPRLGRARHEARPPEETTGREKPLGFDELAALFERRKDDTVALAFAADFMKRPKLARIWSGFRERAGATAARQEAAAQGAEPTAQELARELRREREFAELFTRWSGRPGFRALAESISREPGVAEALRAPEAGEAAAPGGGAPVPAPGQRMFGIFTAGPEGAPGPDSFVATTGEEGAGRAIAGAPQSRRRSDQRLEAHWVDDTSDMSFLAVCRRLGRVGECKAALAQCQGDAGCAKAVAGSPLFRQGGGGSGGVGPSTGTPAGIPPRDRRLDGDGQRR